MIRHTDCGNREEIKIIVVGVLSLAPCYFGKLQVRRDDQSRYHNLKPPSSLGSGWHGQWMEWDSLPPCISIMIRKGEDRRKKKREVLHLFRCYTHTHPAGAGSTLKGKRKKKANTDDGQKAKTAQGGRGTDGPPKPTYTAKRTWPKQCTHLNPTTHYGEARGED